MSKELNKELNKQVANFKVLYEKLHYFHWFVNGENFFVLHEKFQEDYEAIAKLLDDMAERLLMINGLPVFTLKECLEITTLEENQHYAKATNEMVALLIQDYEQVVKELKDVIEIADDEDDEVTEGLLLDIVSLLEKKVWMYKSFLS